MFLPSHTIYLIKVNGEKDNVCMCDLSTKKEVREEVKKLVEEYYDDQLENFIKAQYTDRNGKVLYECTIKECMEEL